MRALACPVLLGVALFPGAARSDGARYLVIAPDSYADALQPLVEWKTRKGVPARVATLSETGYSVQQIRSYIREAAQTWDPAPDYVLIAADMGTIAMASENETYTDTPYASLDDDLFVELIPGRFPAASEVQLRTMVAKTLQYEREPLVEDEAFYRSAALLIYEDHDDDDVCSYWGDATWEASLMSSAGFDEVTIMSYATTPDIHERFEDQLNAGIGWAGHHGVVGSYYDWPSYGVAPEELDNGPMLPVLVGYTCQTVAATDYESYGERWLRAGTPAELIGGVAYVGQALSCSYCAHWRSALRRGFWGYIFEDADHTDIVTFGEAVEAGRLRFYDEFRRADQYQASTALGDPELNLWTDVPRSFDISYPPVVPRGPTAFSVRVTQEGVPRAGVRVCAMSDEGSYAVEESDADGLVSFELDTTRDRLLHLTATGRNLLPFEGEIPVYEGGLGPDTAEPADDTGEPDASDDTSLGDPGVAPGGACGCGGGATAARPLGLLLLPMLLGRRRDGGRA
jgi:hypothetical protein